MTDKLELIQSTDRVHIVVKDKNGLQIGVADASYTIPEDTYYFNRLFVNEEYRGRKYGSRILKSLLSYMDTINKVLELEISPYGEMTYEQLESFYTRYGFKKIGDRYYYEPKYRNI